MTEAPHCWSNVYISSDAVDALAVVSIRYLKCAVGVHETFRLPSNLSTCYS